MPNRVPRDPATREVLSRLRRQKACRRRTRIAAAGAGTLFLAAAALALASLGPPEPRVTAQTQTPLSSPTRTAPAAAPVTAPATQTTRTLPPRPETAEEPVGTTGMQPSGVGDSPPPSTQSRGIVVIDPGHQRRGDSSTEPIGPGAATRKARVSSGTTGVVTGIPESELALAVSLKLRDALQARGITVVMTRSTQDVNLSNIERARIANEARADLSIRVHADGAESSSTHGIHVLYPAVVKGWTDDIAGPSRRAAELAQAELVAATGALDRGIDPRADITGFNWSDVPVIIAEIGFMSNPDEDRLLATEAYRQKIAAALADAAVRFLNER